MSKYTMLRPNFARPILSLICAMDSNRLIGENNALPWHMPADLAFFKKTTMGKPIIMGRKTFESIGKPLPGRTNIIVSRNPELHFPGCDIVGSINEAMTRVQDNEEVMLIGGASLYQQCINPADQIYQTLIHHSFNGDTWFPEIDSEQWKQSTREDYPADASNSYAYSFIKYIRKSK